MPEFSATDSAFMARALQLAARGKYTTSPNPVVGCVIVRDGRVIGEGWHVQAGQAHAEVNALQDAGDARGASVYVTLEPCAHHGRTPPCTQALIDAGVAEVVCAANDPNPDSGGGIAALGAAGIDVRCGLMSADAEAQNKGFMKRVRTGKPRVCIKVAASLDGATGMLNGESQWITGPAARADVQRLRARSCAVMTGIGTVLADDPSLNVRAESIDMMGRQPLRVVLDSGLRMPLSAGMLCLPGRTLVFCTADGRRAALEDAGAEVIKVAADGDAVSIGTVLDELGNREINEALVEAGPSLTGALLAGGHADELVIYQAPQILGSETLPMFATPDWKSLADRVTLDIVDVRKVGADTRITARIR